LPVHFAAPGVYGIFAGEAILVAAKAGADQHPDWYLNIIAWPGIAFQIGGQAFRGEWREPEGEERIRVWNFMTALCPLLVNEPSGARDRDLPSSCG
jgi:hypothetical protein